MQLKNYQQRALNALERYLEVAAEKRDADEAYYKVTEETLGRRISYVDIGKRNGLPELSGLPYVCIRIPTGGGKTLLAAHIPPIAFRHVNERESGIVLWLVPTTAILEQTLAALRNRDHPYRQALVAGLGNVEVMDVGQALYLNRSSLDGGTVVIVATLQSFRIEKPDGRKVYDENGALMDIVTGRDDAHVYGLDRYENGRAKPSLANVLRLYRPLVIVDEAHNARTSLSFDTLARLRPSSIIELTATPDHEKTPSNVLFSVTASELKAEEMIKLPLELTVQPDWQRAIDEALNQQQALERVAEQHEAETGEYIRPILLLQCQSSHKDRKTIDIDVVDHYLKKELKVDPTWVARATGSDWELDGVDLSDPKTPVRVILTVQKLREGWDCPFAYVLASVSNVATATAVEQLVGRVLRMPQARKKQHEALNRAYVVASSTNFAQTLNTLKDALVENGFERVEVESLVQARQPQEEQGSLGPLWAPPKDDLVEVTLADEPTRVEDLPKGVEYVAGSNVLRIPRFLTNRDQQQIYGALTGEDQATVAQILRAATATPAERGVTISVPKLLFKQGDLFETFEKSHLMEVPWALSKTDADLPGYSPLNRRAHGGTIDIAKKGKITIDTGGNFLDTLQVEMSFFAQDLSWKDADLVRWLDRETAAADVTQVERERFLTRLVIHLTRTADFSLTDLIRDRFNLRRAVLQRIEDHRQSARKQAFQLFLDGEGNGDLVVDPNTVFTFPADAVYSQLYTGPIRFRKHFYRNVGHLNGEEEAFAVFLDGLPEVETWVRNPEQKPRHAFWLQTSSDRFYPDFVCKLRDGRILVVEYKGADRYDNPEEVEKRVLGELWAAKSDGQCLFVMARSGDQEVVRRMAGAAK